MDRTRLAALFALGLPLLLLGACDDKAAGTDKAKAAKADGKAKSGKAKAASTAAPAPVRDCLAATPTNTLILAQAWFYTAEGATRPTPGPARLLAFQKTDKGWEAKKIEDGESNVFHKAIFTDSGLITISAEKARLKHWTKGADGCFTDKILWEQSWGGKFNRLRDLEIGDVDGDGADEWVMATHDYGVVAVFNPAEGGAEPQVIELDKKADTFVHEIEIGDVDGDGKMEFFATPSDRNQANASQAGEIVQYKWDGTTYVRTVVDGGEHTHAKEILVTDIDGDGKSEFFGVLEAEMENRQIKEPVKIRQYTAKADGGFDHSDVVSIQDQQTRFLVAGDFDGDGRQELVAAAMRTGLFLIDSEVDKGGNVTWTSTNFDAVSSGFEHATTVFDMDGDGRPELYVAADDQHELKRYTWNPEKKTFEKELIARYDDKVFTWFVAAGKL